MRILAILGASGHGKVAADIALQCGWDEVIFFDDKVDASGRFEHWKLAGNTEAMLNNQFDCSGFFVAIGNNQIRYQKIALLQASGLPLASLVHPKAVVSRFAELNTGVMVVGGAVLNAFCRLGIGSIVNTAATIGHDCTLEECVHVAPGANVAGNVSIGRLSWIGVGSAVRQGVRIGAEVMIGAGAAVVCDVKDGAVMVGVPAKPMDRNGV